MQPKQPRREAPFNAALLVFFAEYHDQYGFAPTIREMCAACAISSTSVASYQLRQMARQGYLKRTHPERTIWVMTEDAYQFVGRQRETQYAHAD